MFTQRIKSAFAVIGLAGSTEDGEGFVQRLWAEANRRFPEVAPLAAKDGQGNLLGIWGAMTDFSRAFLPWEDGFRRGLYLAGVECPLDAAPPPGWTRWVVPGFRYFCVENQTPAVFSQAVAALAAQGQALAGAVQEFTDPVSGQGWLYLPVARLQEVGR